MIYKTSCQNSILINQILMISFFTKNQINFTSFFKLICLAFYCLAPSASQFMPLKKEKSLLAFDASPEKLVA